MEPEYLAARLRLLGGTANSRYPMINLGGCCIYAAAVARKLVRLGLHVEIVLVSFENSDIDACRESVRTNLLKSSWESVGLFFRHLGVRYRVGDKWFVHDSDATLEGPMLIGVNRTPVANGFFTCEEAEAFAEDRTGWNSCFDRAHIPALRLLIRNWKLRQPRKP